MKNNFNMLSALYKVINYFSQPKEKDQYKEHEQLLVNKIIKKLQDSPDDFSAKWFNGKSYLDQSVRSSDRNIQIMISNGQIFNPIEPKMTKEQKQKVKKLIEPIVKRDSLYIIKNLGLD